MTDEEPIAPNILRGVRIFIALIIGTLLGEILLRALGVY